MYTKEELEAMEIPQLMGIAKELGVNVSQDSALEDVIYAIIDKAAENSAAGQAEEAPKRKRTRITKKDTSKVYTVKGKDGENLDSKSNRTKGKTETPSLFSDMPLPPVTEEDASPETEEKAAPVPEAEEKTPKRRGRKPKVAQEEPIKTPEPEEVEEQPQDLNDIIPEAVELSAVDDENDSETANAVQMLREKMASRKEEVHKDDEVSEEGVWEDDPGDGTDFITLIDIPIEDHEAIPSLDIFDRPMAQQPEAEEKPKKQRKPRTKKEPKVVQMAPEPQQELIAFL